MSKFKRGDLIWDCYDREFGIVLGNIIDVCTKEPRCNVYWQTYQSSVHVDPYDRWAEADRFVKATDD